MNRFEFIAEFIICTTFCLLFIWAFASGPNHSWGWKLIVKLGGA